MFIKYRDLTEYRQDYSLKRLVAWRVSWVIPEGNSLPKIRESSTIKGLKGTS